MEVCLEGIDHRFLGSLDKKCVRVVDPFLAGLFGFFAQILEGTSEIEQWRVFRGLGWGHAPLGKGLANVFDGGILLLVCG